MSTIAILNCRSVFIWGSDEALQISIRIISHLPYSSVHPSISKTITAKMPSSESRGRIC